VQPFPTSHGVTEEVREVKKACSLLVFLFLLVMPGSLHAQGAYPYQPPENQEGIDPSANTVIGAFRDYVITKEDTLLDIARNFDLGYNELVLAYPSIDPWSPPAGEKISIPTEWVLPSVNKKGIVINVPELRLYLFFNDIHMVKTYPIGIGVLDSPTPFGKFTIIEKTKNPTWNIPLSLQEKYGRKSLPPGPDNPLGAYRLRLSNYEYGIHGTNIPWGIGRLVSHGCIRLYPEDIEELFSLVKVGTPVEIIYEPIKLGLKEGHIFVEVHPDLYNETTDFLLHTAKKLFTAQIWEEVDLDLLAQALEEHKGIPIDITRKK
jgi:L,D-transpeptidase ErfK/SrfK